MFRLRTFLIGVWVVLLTHTLFAAPHNNAWFRGTLGIPINNKIKVDAELQHRRQNGFDKCNPLDKNLMLSLRNWVHYQHNDNLKFTVSPFAYFYHYRIIQKQDDENMKPSNEVRFSAAVELQQPIFRKFYVANRTTVEYRMFNNGQNITRARYRFGGRYEFSRRLKTIGYDEVFLNVSGVSSVHFFDQNRISISLEYKISSQWKFDAGYMYLTRSRQSNNSFLYENNILLNLTYELPAGKK